ARVRRRSSRKTPSCAGPCTGCSEKRCRACLASGRCGRSPHEHFAGRRRRDARMRVIAGRLGGRRLSAPRGRTTRPTSDRVREALFSMLGPIDGTSVLDLFAGTGALGIEALSRGAAKALFVERDAAAVAALKGNLARLELGEPQARVRVGEALAALRSARSARETYDLVFVDPPYDQLRDS